MKSYKKEIDIIHNNVYSISHDLSITEASFVEAEQGYTKAIYSSKLLINILKSSQELLDLIEDYKISKENKSHENENK